MTPLSHLPSAARPLGPSPRRHRLRARIAFATLIASSSLTPSLQADEPDPTAADANPPEVDEATRRGTEAFKRGLSLAAKEQWGDALAAFEEAAAARDAPTVQYNIAYCQRALGRYVAARATARRLLATPGDLAASYQRDLAAFADEFDAIIARVTITVSPPGAQLTVDGRPLVARPDAPPGTFVAGVDGKALSRTPAELVVELDPGSHLFRAQRPGHRDVVVQRAFTAGQKTSLALRLDEMPATIVVDATEPNSIVRVDDREVGLAPIEFERPAGEYRLEVVKDDFETYFTELDLSAGQRAAFRAEMKPYETPIEETWWFWTLIGAAVTGGVITTVILTRPEPKDPPYDTGNTGWLVQPATIRF